MLILPSSPCGRRHPPLRRFAASHGIRAATQRIELALLRTQLSHGQLGTHPRRGLCTRPIPSAQSVMDKARGQGFSSLPSFPCLGYA